MRVHSFRSAHFARFPDERAIFHSLLDSIMGAVNLWRRLSFPPVQAFAQRKPVLHRFRVQSCLMRALASPTAELSAAAPDLVGYCREL
jgi:hypothetical protein